MYTDIFKHFLFSDSSL